MLSVKTVTNIYLEKIKARNKCKLSIVSSNLHKPKHLQLPILLLTLLQPVWKIKGMYVGRAGGNQTPETLHLCVPFWIVTANFGLVDSPLNRYRRECQARLPTQGNLCGVSLFLRLPRCKKEKKQFYMVQNRAQLDHGCVSCRIINTSIRQTLQKHS